MFQGKITDAENKPRELWQGTSAIEPGKDLLEPRHDIKKHQSHHAGRDKVQTAAG